MMILNTTSAEAYPRSSVLIRLLDPLLVPHWSLTQHTRSRRTKNEPHCCVPLLIMITVAMTVMIVDIPRQIIEQRVVLDLGDRDAVQKTQSIGLHNVQKLIVVEENVRFKEVQGGSLQVVV